MRAKLIDISHWQSKVDWDAIKQSVSMVIIKSSEAYWNKSSCFYDSMIKSHVEGAMTRGIPLTYYHFYRPTVTGELQADYMLSIVGDYVDYPLVLDFENGTGATGKNLGTASRKFCERIAERTGIKPIIYTRLTFLQQYGFSNFSWMKDYIPWLAQYPFDKRKDFVQNYSQYELSVEEGKGNPLVSPIWTDWKLWQWTGHGRVPGISGDVDKNVFNGTEKDFNEFFGINEEPSPQLTYEEKVDVLVDAHPQLFR